MNDDHVEFYYVKNWWKYQDYRFTRPPWIRLYPSLLEDPRFIELSEINQWRLVKLFLYASEIDGRLPGDPTKIGRRLGLYHRASCCDLISIFIAKGFISQQDVRGLRKCKTAPEQSTEQSTEKRIQTPIINIPPKQQEPKTKRFQKPNRDELKAYMLELGFPHCDSTADEFIDYYESKGWLVGKTAMKDWRAAARTWKRNESRFSGNGNGHAPKPAPAMFAPGQSRKVVQFDGLWYDSIEAYKNSLRSDDF